MEQASDTEDVLKAAASWLKDEGAVALATVVRTWGSSPRPAGSQMATAASGRLAGSVSGGCVETAVAEAAQEVLRTGEPRLLFFGVSDERAWSLGLACGGQIEVFVERLGTITPPPGAVP